MPACKDHTGQKYASVQEMCQQWHIPYYLYHWRKTLWNWPTKKALETEYRPEEDPLLPILQDIAKKLNLPVSDCMDKIVPAFQKQIDPNIQTIDEALILMMNHIKADHEAKKTQEMRNKVDASQSDLQSRPDVLRDHEGRCFSSKNQMARYHGLSHATLRFRLEQDMDLQEALTKPVRQPGCTDHEGRNFDTVHEMAAWYGIKYATLEQRLGSGMPLGKALTTLPPNTVIDDKLIVLSNIEGPYYNVLFQNKEDVWTHHQILTYLHQNTPAQE